MPHFSTHSTTCVGDKSTCTPNASSTSAEPQHELTLRFPALATVAPQAAAKTTLAVLMLMVSAPSPPVPTMSNNFFSSVKDTVSAAAFMARTIDLTYGGVLGQYDGEGIAGLVGGEMPIASDEGFEVRFETHFVLGCGGGDDDDDDDDDGSR